MKKLLLVLPLYMMTIYAEKQDVMATDIKDIINKIANVVNQVQENIPKYQIRECRFTGDLGWCGVDTGYDVCVAFPIKQAPKFLGKMLRYKGDETLWIGHTRKCIMFDAKPFAQFLEKYRPLLEFIQPIEQWLPEKVAQQLQEVRTGTKVAGWLLPHINKISFCIDSDGNVTVAVGRKLWPLWPSQQATN
ncbi:hypothetical protein A3F06_04145 [candidate division TM6 bacterium RIFCSPHIGHO2_12_FULL_36_22]|nr:MAG: hypothetical protein A3F06_04145 [candidate division TM6 bacterium RIFCSPHIGHO2_12_FULL_36_22]HLB43283.1 hypothetical protein [Gammaproteobacteria bacterium]